jgi:hydroxymethylpyrimidine/phosphomethylpyrimidine kinase
MELPLADEQPVVLSINSHDPSGGAGSVADIETVASLGGHCVSAITALNVRDTRSLKDRLHTDATLLIEQSRAALEDCNVRAIKVGDLASVAQLEAVHTILVQYRDIPVVLDPVLLHDDDGEISRALNSLLLPVATLSILSLDHVARLGGRGDTLQASLAALFELGVEQLLVTDLTPQAPHCVNALYNRHGNGRDYEWPRLPHAFHGAGSTLSAALATYLGHGFDLLEAIQQAQQFTWQALNGARALGGGALIPDRFFWARDSQ